MNYNKLCFLLGLIVDDLNRSILTIKVANERTPKGGMMSAINDYERLLINLDKLARYCHL